MLPQLIGGLRSGMGSPARRDIDELRTEARFVRVTAAGLQESHAHDVRDHQGSPQLLDRAVAPSEPGLRAVRSFDDSEIRSLLGSRESGPKTPAPPTERAIGVEAPIPDCSPPKALSALRELDVDRRTIAKAPSEREGLECVEALREGRPGPSDPH